MMDLASKAGMKADNADALNLMLLPFERAITELINSAPPLRERFMSGNVEVVDEVFKQLYAPHLQQRIREKKARTEPSPFPRATPRTSSAPQVSPDAKPDTSTPKGRAAFHKNAVASWFSKMQTDE